MYEDVDGLPVKVKGTRVQPVEDSMTEFKGQHYITLIAVDEQDDRVWEFCTETGRIFLTKGG